MAHPPYDPYYLPLPIHHHPPPPPPPQYHYQQDDGINTLFVSGLPDDVQAREIHNLFRRKPGFDFCQLKYTGRGNQVAPFLSLIPGKFRNFCLFPSKILNFLFIYRESIRLCVCFQRKMKTSLKRHQKLHFFLVYVLLCSLFSF